MGLIGLGIIPDGTWPLLSNATTFLICHCLQDWRPLGRDLLHTDPVGLQVMICALYTSQP